MNEIQGRWTLVEIRREGEDVIKMNEPSEHLEISKDRFYSTRFQFDTVHITKPEVLDTIFSDTIHKGFDYYVKGEQLLLEDMTYFPSDLDIGEAKIAYRDSQIIKILTTRSSITIKQTSATEMIYSMNDIEKLNFVYRRMENDAKVYTQEDLRKSILKMWKKQGQMAD